MTAWQWEFNLEDKVDTGASDSFAEFTIRFLSPSDSGDLFLYFKDTAKETGFEDFKYYRDFIDRTELSFKL